MNYFLKDAKICVSGSFINGHAIGVFPENLERAKANVEYILSQSEKKQYILIGAEHLFFLNASHQDKGILFILEPSADYLNFVRTSLTQPNQSQSWPIISGHWGPYSPLMDPKLGQTFLSQELGKIAWEIFQLKDETKQSTERLSCQSPDDPLLPILTETIQTTLSCKNWHREQAATYAGIRAAPKNKFVYFLHHHKHALTEADLSLIRALLPEQDIRPLALGPDPTQTLATLQENPPSFVAMLNRSAFQGLEDVLYYETLFQRAGIPLHFYFTDRFGHQSDLINGGWSYFHWNQHRLPQSADQVFTIYKEHEPLTLPTKGDCQFIAYPYRNLLSLAPRQDSVSPEKSAVAIVNYCRLFALSDEISMEFFDVLTATLGPKNSGQPYAVFEQMRETISTLEPFARKPHLGQVIINRLDYLFYNQLRIRKVLEFVTANPTLNLDVYGHSWDKILPAGVCRGPISNTEQLAGIYRGAVATLDFTTALLDEQPHFMVIECLFSGGFPICYAEPKATRRAGSWLDDWPLPTYSCLEEIPGIIQSHKEPALQQALLREAKLAFDKWHAKFKIPSGFSVQPWARNLKPDVLVYLANVGIGYMLYQLGFMADAAKTWQALPISTGPAAELLKQRLQVALQKSHKGQYRP